ncbi:MAG TPA: hypothetical protein VNY84_03025 [Acidimicrobiales bacterium]|nr:hypothetical protein [Acidimicrobiales bacterium]
MPLLEVIAGLGTLLAAALLDIGARDRILAVSPAPAVANAGSRSDRVR